MHNVGHEYASCKQAGLVHWLLRLNPLSGGGRLRTDFVPELKKEKDQPKFRPRTAWRHSAWPDPGQGPFITVLDKVSSVLLIHLPDYHSLSHKDRVEFFF